MLLAKLLLYRFSRSQLNPCSDPITQDLAPFSTPEDLPYQPYLRALSSVLHRPKIHFAYISNDFGRLKQGLVRLEWRRASSNKESRPESLAEAVFEWDL